MEKLYSSSKTQIILMVVFGNLLGLALLIKASDAYDGFGYFVGSLIVFFITWFIFIGWKKQNKQLSMEVEGLFSGKFKNLTYKTGGLFLEIFSFVKKNRLALIGLVGAIVFLIIMASDASKKKSYHYIPSQAVPQQVACIASVSDLTLVESYYETYSLGNSSPQIGSNQNAVRVYGLIKNNSNCKALNVKIKIILQSSKNPDIKQEELVTALSFGDSINPQQTKEFSRAIDAFESLIYKQSSYGYIDRASLRSGVSINTQIISADWIQ